MHVSIFCEFCCVRLRRGVTQYICNGRKNPFSTLRIFDLALNWTRIAGFVGGRSPSELASPGYFRHFLYYKIFVLKSNFSVRRLRAIIRGSKNSKLYTLKVINLVNVGLQKYIWYSINTFRENKIGHKTTGQSYKANLT